MQKVEQYRRACVEMDLFFFMLVSLDSQICSRAENVVSRFQTIKICRQGEFHILNKMTTPLSHAFAAQFAMDGSKLDET